MTLSVALGRLSRREVAYSSRKCNHHWNKRKKNEEDVCTATSHGDKEFESGG